MSTPDDTLPVIEDEPYQGLYRGRHQAGPRDHDHVANRFDLAEILRNTRTARGLSLDDVAEITRVRRSYLEAFEQAAYDILPPRPFALGYIKAYARALDLDAETLADMFKAEVVEPQVRLHAPSGASLEDVKPNYRLYIGAALTLVAAIVIWNVFQHQPLQHSTPSVNALQTDQAWSPGVPVNTGGLMVLTQPEAAPRDQDIPMPYITPGLEEGFASLNADRGTPVAPVVDPSLLGARKAFNPRGAVYGAAPESSTVTLQTDRSVNLVVRAPDGRVFFARQLGAGEAYRVPAEDLQNLTIEVSDFNAFEVYYNGEYAGRMEANTTPVGRLNAKASALADALDAREAAAQAAAGGAPAPSVVPQKPVMKPSGPIPYTPSVKAPAPTSAKPAASAEPAPLQ